jgi:hypothetical protein
MAEQPVNSDKARAAKPTEIRRKSGWDSLRMTGLFETHTEMT